MIEERMTTNKSKTRGVADEVAKLRAEYMEIIQKGLGRDSISQAEEVEMFKGLEDSVEEVFLLAAKVRLARKLGISRWLAAEITSSFPEEWKEDP